MTRILRDIIGGKEPTFSSRINQLESSTGKKTIDIELTAEILSKLNDVTKKLSLDPLDTTPEELYHALIQKAKEHDVILRSSYHENINELLRKINRHPSAVTVPVIKQSTLRNILSKNPPKKVMVRLGYRSITSMLKRCDLDQVLLGAFLLESVTWHRSFAKIVKQCKVSDMTLEMPRAVVVDQKLLKGLKQPLYIPHVQLAGLIGLPSNNLKKSFGWLEFAARATDSLFFVHQRGIFLKLNRFQPDIIKKIVDLTYLAPLSVSQISKVRIPWSSVYAFISNNIDMFIFTDESSVERNDFVWNGSVEVLKNVHTQLDFWKSTRLIAKPTDSHPVSLNLSDIAFNALYGLSYSDRSYVHLARQTLEELLSRYFTNYDLKDDLLADIGIYA